jgi:transglutaminase-like putative cysteine protease
MQRHVSVQMEVAVTQPAMLALQIAVATAQGSDRLIVTVDGREQPVRELASLYGGRVHVIDAPVGDMSIDYEADVPGEVLVPPSNEIDLLLYRRPSRYCPSDRFTALAAAEFGGIAATADVCQAVRDWVNRRLLYISGSSGPTDDAIDTLLLGEAVCRDYAHLVVALLRAQDIPARLVAVYAPGLSPMDFHAVAEAFVDGAWQVLDATGLAPRPSMLRIATGRDAADTAFMSVHDGFAELRYVQVLAVADELPQDDPTMAAVLI